MQDSQSFPQFTDSSSPQELWTDVEGLRVRYLRAGAGPPLVLLHGLLGYSFSWRFNIPVFAEQRSVYAVDMPGAGFSQRSAKLDCSFRGSALRFLAFAKNLGLGAYDLLGTSHGGAVAMLAAAIANQSSGKPIRRLILVAPVNPWSAHGRQLAPWLAAPFVREVLNRCIPYMSFANGAVVRRLYGDPRRISPGTIEGYAKPYTTNGSLDYVFNILRSWNSDLEELQQSLPLIADIPSLLIWGSRDTAVDPNSGAILARHLRHCECIQFPGVGHLPYEEVPNEFNRAVLSFLERSAAAE